MVSFDHRDPGTADERWVAAEQWSAVPWFQPVAVSRAVVVSAHPDDETLGAGGLVSRLARRGTRLTLIVATRGEAAHSRDLGARRMREFEAASRRLAPDCRIVDLGLPDSMLDGSRELLQEAVARELDEAALLIAPWRGDGHRDHRMAGEVAHQLSGQGAELLEYPIWLWHWAEPDDERVPWEQFARVRLDAAELRTKRAAWDVYSSQAASVDGEAPIVHERMRAHFFRPWETFVRTPA